MVRRFCALAGALVLMLSISAQALAPRRAEGCTLSLNFSDGLAYCTTTCTGSSTSDTIFVTMTLSSRDGPIASWSDTDKYQVMLDRFCSVTSGQTYTLTVAYSINGVAQTTKRVSKVCR